MKENMKQYTVNDYSQIDRHLDQVNNREKAFTDRIKIQNFFNFAIASLIFCFAIGLLILLIGWSFRLMVYGPKETKIIEKPIEHPHSHHEHKSEIIKSNSDDKLNSKAIKILKNLESQNTGNANNVLSNVKVFNSVSTNIGSFDSVLSRWGYSKGNDTTPSDQSCYADGNKDGISVKLELAYLSNNTVKTHYSSYKAEKYGISKTQWDNLIKKCQWFRN